MTVYTWGYMQPAAGRRSAWPVAELERLRQERNALVVDTRFKPSSRLAQWRRPYLERRFGDDYVWIQAFGNANFAAGPIVLVDPAAGLAQLEPLVSAARPPLLLCMCPTTACHRTAVAEYLAQQAGWAIEHLVPAARSTNGVTS